MLKIKEEIKNWLNFYTIKDYSINEDLTVNINNSIDLSYWGFEKIPIKFSKINGDFDCSRNKLTSLDFCPDIIEGDFNCSNNSLKSLEFCSKKINGSLNCSYNQLSSLEFSPKEINESFNCSNNKLTTLEFSPKIIKKDFIFNDNKLILDELYLFNSSVSGKIISGFGLEFFLRLVAENKILKEKELLNINLKDKNYNHLVKKRL